MLNLNLTGDFAYNEEVYHYALLFSQTVGSAVNWFTLLVIYVYKGQEMTSYRWHLFFYQLSSTLLDFAMDTMAQPLFFFPYMAGTAQGWLRTVFGMHSFTTTTWAFGSGCLHFIFFSPLYYRWQLLLPYSARFKFQTEKRKIAFQIFMFLLCPALYFLINLPYEEEDQAKRDFIQHNPQDAKLAEIDGFYVLNTWKNKLVLWTNLCTLLLLTLFLMFVATMAVGCAQSLNSAKGHMSQKTRQIHIRFLKNIFFQFSVPMLLLEFPILYWFFSMFFELRFPGHQDLTNLSVFCTGVHGLFGSFVVFYLNPSYRAFFGTKLRHCMNVLFGVKLPIVDPSNAAAVTNTSAVA